MASHERLSFLEGDVCPMENEWKCFFSRGVNERLYKNNHQNIQDKDLWTCPCQQQTSGLLEGGSSYFYLEAGDTPPEGKMHSREQKMLAL